MSASSWSFIAGGAILCLAIAGIVIGYFLSNAKFKDRSPKN